MESACVGDARLLRDLELLSDRDVLCLTEMLVPSVSEIDEVVAELVETDTEADEQRLWDSVIITVVVVVVVAQSVEVIDMVGISELVLVLGEVRTSDAVPLTIVKPVAVGDKLPSEGNENDLAIAAVHDMIRVDDSDVDELAVELLDKSALGDTSDVLVKVPEELSDMLKICDGNSEALTVTVLYHDGLVESSNVCDADELRVPLLMRDVDFWKERVTLGLLL